MSQDNTSNNKRIVKNTAILYFRMFLMMAVSLYTSRIVLQVLGETDYGIYNIIGGVVIFFSFINNAFLQATQRYLNFELGKNNNEGVSRIFSMSMNAYIILAIIFLFLSETIGLWFVNTQLNIPVDRMVAANWVYQFSIITFIICLIQVPYNATIIAYEKMSFFAYLSLFEVCFKLFCVFLLFKVLWDKLVFFSFFYTLTPFIIVLTYKYYCNKHFSVTRYHLVWDKKTFKELFSFSSWSLFGNLSNILATQGLNILVNIFFGVVVNAALGIANQISAKVNQFMTNFQMAFNPQIVKLYAAKDTDKLYTLIFRTSKFSYYLMFLISLPIMIKMDAILSIWLVEVPEYTAIFSQLILGFMLIEALTGPLWMYVQATGDIKQYQLLIGGLIFLNLPLSYIVLKMGFPAYSVWIIRIIINLLVFMARCIYLKYRYFFPIKNYVNSVLFPTILVSILSIPLPIYIGSMNISRWSSIIITTLVSTSVFLFFMLLIGINSSEKDFLFSSVKRKLRL